MNRSNVYNVVHLGIAFFLIFMSFGVAQIFQTSSDHPRSGAIALSIVYSCFCVSNLMFASYLTRLLNVRLSLILASFTYVAFVACNIKYNIWILYITSFTLGLGASLLWTAQGVYVTLSTSQHEVINDLSPSSTRGFMNGVFFACFQVSFTLGSLIAAFLFRFKLRQWIIFTIMTVISGCGTLSLIL